jgi:branched-chain amino acid aminotransferase
MEFINVNGETLARDQFTTRVDNHSYRYGDGLFETMKVKNERILLRDLHFERLFSSLTVLRIPTPKFFTAEHLAREIIETCRKNKCAQLGRVRLSVTRGNGGLYDADENFQWIIECWPLNASTNKLNENGLIIDIFPDVKKSCDIFSNLKSASHLPYVMGAVYAKENKLNDCLLLNTYGRICDSTIANVFWVKDGNIFTPPLKEGCIAGVMRRFLIESAQGSRYKVQEQSCEVNELEEADEVFLTNAIQGIRWVKQFRDKSFGNDITRASSRSLFEVD